MSWINANDRLFPLFIYIDQSKSRSLFYLNIQEQIFLFCRYNPLHLVTTRRIDVVNFVRMRLSIHVIVHAFGRTKFRTLAPCNAKVVLTVGVWLGWLVGWLVGWFDGISTSNSYLMPMKLCGLSTTRYILRRKWPLVELSDCFHPPVPGTVGYKSPRSPPFFVRRRGQLPSWFWIWTKSPICNFRSGWQCLM